MDGFSRGKQKSVSLGTPSPDNICLFYSYAHKKTRQTGRCSGCGKAVIDYDSNILIEELSRGHLEKDIKPSHGIRSS
jgi:hypothetical protein